MSKNIILLSDGTGNSASKLFKTNVWRLYKALDLSETDPAARKQIAYYDDGVGTASFRPLAIFGGAFGWGTKRNVLDLYTFLCRHYDEGDSIYCFGFSRGAFTIRMLTGFIANRGLVRAETEGELRHLAAEAFRAYREDRYKRTLTTPFRLLRKVILQFWHKITGKAKYDPTKKRPIPKIKFLGLWDTVAAYGLPIDELTSAWDFLFPLSFPDRNLSDIVDCACHALAIDDERLSFHPELWNENANDYGKRPLGDRLTQVWFAGMHSNVGGGYPDDALSGIPLNWITDKAGELGLKYLEDERERLREAACINGKKYDSRRGLAGAYRYRPRKIKDLTHDDSSRKNRVIIDIPKIHESVFIRIKNRVDGYAPIGLPDRYEVVSLNNSHPKPEDHIEKIPADRANRQEKLWNLVWWKRVVYFITVILFVLLAAFPLYYSEPPNYDHPVSLVIGKVGSFLPDFLSPWLKSYQGHPVSFLIIAALFAGVLFVASKLQRRIFDNMRSIFDTPVQAHSPVSDPPRDAIFRLRSNRRLKNFSKWFKEKFIPWVILVIVAIIIFRSLFTVIDSFGLVATPTSGDLKSSLADATFNSNDLCWASGVKVEEGKRYRITLTIKGENQAKWKDDKIPATTGGIKKADIVPAMYLGLPLRRHIAEPWFKPIARIGETGRDDYPLDPQEGSGSDDQTLISEIKARRSGELFLFVNDAVLPLPKAWQYFYKNNHGTALVTVEPLD